MKFALRDDERCDSEVLVRSTTIQPHVKLAIIDPKTMGIVAASENHAFQAPLASENVFATEDLREISADLASGAVPISRNLRLLDGQDVWCDFFKTDEFVGCEMTAVDADSAQYQQAARYFAKSLRSLNQRAQLAERGGEPLWQAFLSSAVKRIRGLTGYDRVMIYKFDSDWNGTVVSESSEQGVPQSFLGLTFPSGDIPKPARDLFYKNPIRIIADVAASDVSVLQHGQAGPLPFEFDSTNALCRHVSSIHQKFLSNMRVSATMVFGLVVGRKLWGMIACHHYQSAFTLPPIHQTLARALIETIVAHMTSIFRIRSGKAREKINSFNDMLLKDIETAGSAACFQNALFARQQMLLDLFGCSSVIVDLGDQTFSLGAPLGPGTANVVTAKARDWCKAHGQSHLCTSDLSQTFQLAREFDPQAAGLAAVSSHDHNMGLYLFRARKARKETWAGDPEKVTERSPERAGSFRIDPRRSFERFETATKRACEVWPPETIERAKQVFEGMKRAYEMHRRLTAESRLKQEMQTSTYLALHDQLTGLPNRRAFEEKLGQYASNGGGGWLLHIDLDRFKRLNDNHGLEVGDGALRHIATVLANCAAEKSYAARIGEDEFVLLVQNIQSEYLLEAFCRKLLGHLDEPFFVRGRDFTVSCSVGITKLDPVPLQMPTALTRSDVALNEAKRTANSSYAFCTPALELKAAGLRKLEAEIENGLGDGQFVPYFQPQIATKTGEIEGFEVLVRWKHPEKGVISPVEFLNVAGNSGLLDAIDRSIFRQSMRMAKNWRRKTGTIPKLAFNIGDSRLASTALREDLEANQHDNDGLTLELLETIYFDDPEVDHTANIAELKAFGVSIAIDDFGSGRSSLLAITALEPDYLKIDRRLVQPIVGSDAAENLIVSIKSIADRMGIETVAEGVETDKHQSIIEKIGCGLIQGFHIARPLDEHEALVFLQQAKAA